jgi:ATP-dependent RNA helicase DeaD
MSQNPHRASFRDLALRPELLAALDELGHKEPTPIQQAAIPPLLEGRDLIGHAATGTGKTAAFALPLLQRLGARDQIAAPCGIVLVPTRELAMQVTRAIGGYGRYLGARVLPLFGGQPIPRQIRALEQGVDVVVATPGRALDHLRRATLRLDAIETVVLDEADEMLDMGFAEDIEAILDALPNGRQSVFFSATFARRIDRIARQHLRNPLHVRAAPSQTHGPGEAPRVRQLAYLVARAHKPAALRRVLDIEAPAATLVFCRTRDEVDELAESLNARGYRAEALHGGMGQDQRDRAMGRLRAKAADLVVATDVAARGLDIEQLTHVVNYDVPASPEAYIHRIGRIGRAGRAGVAITLAEPRSHHMLTTIEHATSQPISLAQLPTLADVQARRLERTRHALEESIRQDDLSGYQAVAEALFDAFDPMAVAVAAIKLAFEASGATTFEEEIPPASPIRKPVNGRPQRFRKPSRSSAIRQNASRMRVPRERLGSPRQARGRS